MAAPVEEVPWRCTRCGANAPPDPLFTQLDPRYSEGHCPICHTNRTLVRAKTVGEATAGYRSMLEAKERKAAEKGKLKDEKR